MGQAFIFLRKIAISSAAFSCTFISLVLMLTIIGSFNTTQVILASTGISLCSTLMFKESKLASSLALAAVFILFATFSELVSATRIGVMSNAMIAIGFIFAFSSLMENSKKTIIFLGVGICIAILISLRSGTLTTWFTLGYAFAGLVAFYLAKGLSYSFRTLFIPIDKRNSRLLPTIVTFLTMVVMTNVLLGSVFSIVEQISPGQFLISHDSAVPTSVDFIIASAPLLFQGNLIGIEPVTVTARALISVASLLNLVIMVIYLNLLLVHSSKQGAGGS